MLSPKIINFSNERCMKSVHIRSFASPYFPTFALKTERYGFKSECGKIQTRKTPNIYTFHTVEGTVLVYDQFPETIFDLINAF